MPLSIAFFGASTGCGLAAMKTALEAGHTCIALCRNPSKLDDLAASYPSLLTVIKGNAHDVDAVESCILRDGRLVDAVSFSIGGTMRDWKFDDPDVCKNGVAALRAALAKARDQHGARGRPLVVVVSTTGISRAGRDLPILMLPMYKLLMGTPHADKLVMEEAVAGSGERFVVVRPSFLVDGDDEAARVRVGVEDVATAKVEAREIGYTISRGAVGRWIYGNLLSQAAGSQYEGKAVSLTW